jgi:hypothetical protein
MEEDQVGTELFLYFDSSTARPVQYRPRELSYADFPISSLAHPSPQARKRVRYVALRAVVFLAVGLIAGGSAFSRGGGGCGPDFLDPALCWERVVGDPSPHEAHGQGLLIDQILHAESQ